MIAIPLLLAGLTVSLSPQAMVRGTEITLGEIAMISGGTPEEVALVSQVHLGYAPAPGYSRLLQGGLIAQQVRKALPGEALLFMGSTTCRVKPEVIVISAKRIRSAVTDSDGTIRYDREMKPGVSNLLAIQSAFSGRPIADIVADYQTAGAGYGALKTDTADALEAFVTPLRGRFDEFMSDRAELERILADGAEKARAVAGPVLSQVYQAVGFTAPRRG